MHHANVAGAIQVLVCQGRAHLHSILGQSNIGSPLARITRLCYCHHNRRHAFESLCRLSGESRCRRDSSHFHARCGLQRAAAPEIAVHVREKSSIKPEYHIRARSRAEQHDQEGSRARATAPERRNASVVGGSGSEARHFSLWSTPDSLTRSVS